MRSLFVIAAVLVLATGCRDLRGWDEVEKAFDSPSGTVSDSTVPVALDTYKDSSKADGANSAAGAANPAIGGALDALYASLGSELSTRGQALIGECDLDIKLNRDMVPRKVTLDCGSDGEPSGVLSVELVWDDSMLTELYIDYGMWCADGACIDGAMGMKMDLGGETGFGLTSSFLFNAKFRVIEGGHEDDVELAWRASTDGTYGDFEWLVWANGESVVMRISLDTAGGHFSIRGANGEFTCDYSVDGDTGSCSGPEGSFSWSVTVEDV